MGSYWQNRTRAFSSPLLRVPELRIWSCSSGMDRFSCSPTIPTEMAALAHYRCQSWFVRVLSTSIFLPPIKLLVMDLSLLPE